MTHDELHRLRDRVFRSVVLALEHIVNAPDDEDLSLLDVLADRTAVEPSEELETRELLGYLRDAVDLLPERHRLVIVGYFLEGRSSLDLAQLLDVTESRISQLRSEVAADAARRHRGAVRVGARSRRPTAVPPAAVPTTPQPSARRALGAIGSPAPRATPA